MLYPHNATSLENSTEYAIFCQKVKSFCSSQSFNPAFVCPQSSTSNEKHAHVDAGKDCVAGTKLDDRAQVNPAQLSLELVLKVSMGNSNLL